MPTDLALYATFPAGPVLRPLLRLAEHLGTGVRYTLRQQSVPRAGADSAARIWLVRVSDWLGDDPGSDRAAARFEAHVDALATTIGRTRTAVVVCPSPLGSVRDETAWEDRLVTRLAGLPSVTVLVQSEVVTAGVECYRSDDDGEPLYTNAFHLALATVVSRIADQWVRPPYKVVAVDADHTLWDGACGESAAGELRIGQGRAAFHETLLRLRRRGMLLCLVTKNDPDDVAAAFAGISSPLSLEDFVVVAAGWEPKSTMLARAAAELDLHLSSFVYLDDNPGECAAVRSAAPEVLTVRFPQRDEDIPGLLAHLWAFDMAEVTEEDTHRTERYRDAAARRQARAEAADHAEFVASLGLEVTVREARPADLPRVAQLADRVTQFVTNPGLRPEGVGECLVVEVSDRYGDYGLAGVVVVDVDRDALLVHTFLLSCRVLLRDVEYTVFRLLSERAAAGGLAVVRFSFAGTSRNHPARTFLVSLAASWSGAEGGSGTSWADVSVHAEPSVARTVAAAAGESPEATGTHRRNEVLSTIAEWPGESARLGVLLRGAAHPADATRPAGLWVAALCTLWEEALDVPVVGPDVDLFGEFGATSVDALLVSGGLRRTLGTSLSLAELLSRPTVLEQAGALMTRAGAPVPTVTRVRRGEGVPIVLFAPAGGLGYAYLELVRQLNGDNEVFVAQAPELMAGDRPLLGLPELVSTYLDELERTVPAGPIVFGGWSFGAVLAWEVAGAVASAGTAVPALLLFDPPVPAAEPGDVSDEPIVRFYDMLDPHRVDAESLAGIDRELFPELPPAGDGDPTQLYARLLDRMLARTSDERRRRIFLPELTAETVLQAARVWKKNHALAAAYTPAPGELPALVGTVHVFCGEPSGRPHVLRPALPTRTVERCYALRPVGVLGAHSAMMERPNVDLFAADVNDAVRLVRAGTAGSGTELTVAGIWSRVVGTRPDRETDFFRAGGTSLAGAVLVNSVNKEFGTALTVGDLFARARFGDFVDLLDVTARGVPSGVRTGPAGVEGEALAPSANQVHRLDGMYRDRRRAAERGIPRSAGLMVFRYSSAEPVDLRRMTDAAVAVVDRHSVLRSRFALVDGDWRVEVGTAAVPEVTAATVAPDEWTSTVFDLDGGCWLRIVVLPRGSGSEVVVVTDHLVFDELSADVLATDLWRHYSGRPVPTAADDYYRWSARQHAAIAGPRGAAAASWWRATLRETGLFPDLPFTPGRPDRSARVERRIVGADWRRVLADLPALRVTPAEYAFTAFVDAMFQSFPEMAHLVAHVPFANRDLDTLDSVGWYANVGAVAVTSADAKTCHTDRAALVAERLRAAASHADLPLHAIVPDIDPVTERLPRVFVNLRLADTRGPGAGLTPEPPSAMTGIRGGVLVDITVHADGVDFVLLGDSRHVEPAELVDLGQRIGPHA